MDKKFKLYSICNILKYIKTSKHYVIAKSSKNKRIWRNFKNLILLKIQKINLNIFKSFYKLRCCMCYKFLPLKIIVLKDCIFKNKMYMDYSKYLIKNKMQYFVMIAF